MLPAADSQRAQIQQAAQAQPQAQAAQVQAQAQAQVQAQAPAQAQAAAQQQVALFQQELSRSLQTGNPTESNRLLQTALLTGDPAQAQAQAQLILQLTQLAAHQQQQQAQQAQQQAQEAAQLQQQQPQLQPQAQPRQQQQTEPKDVFSRYETALRELDNCIDQCKTDKIQMMISNFQRQDPKFLNESQNMITKAIQEPYSRFMTIKTELESHERKLQSDMASWKAKETQLMELAMKVEHEMAQVNQQILQVQVACQANPSLLNANPILQQIYNQLTATRQALQIRYDGLQPDLSNASAKKHQLVEQLGKCELLRGKGIPIPQTVNGVYEYISTLCSEILNANAVQAPSQPALE